MRLVVSASAQQNSAWRAEAGEYFAWRRRLTGLHFFCLLAIPYQAIQPFAIRSLSRAYPWITPSDTRGAAKCPCFSLNAQSEAVRSLEFKGADT